MPSAVINMRVVGMGILILLISLLMASVGLIGSLALLTIPPICYFLIISFRKPELILYTVLVVAFLISMLSRYIPGIPFGLTVDALLLLLVIALIFHKGYKSENHQRNNTLVGALAMWLFFSIAMIFNPQASSTAAWVYANRGLSFYPILFVILVLHTINGEKQLFNFLLIWAVFSVFGTFWGIKQLLLGVSLTEQIWLNNGAASTHILFGKLRVFSYFSDSAQFGANQAHTALVFGIIGLYNQGRKMQIVSLIVAALALYGMLISGTRGVLAVLAIGGFTYLIMTKNFRIIVLGLMVAIGCFVFLKYTSIGQSNYQINRMRTALDFDDPSLKVRQDRVKTLSNYLSDKPIGGGIGSAGFWGNRFTPGTFLAEIGTDGHYTRIWMETGIIGLYLYIASLIIIILYLGRLLWRMKNGRKRQILLAFYCGFVGLCAASYTNGLITQFPTGALTFASLGFVYLGVKGKISSKI
ncbi:MAG: O-antigen ligase family protein [Cyclobacteriaceae bacterium]